MPINRTTSRPHRTRIDFLEVDEAALLALPEILDRFAPGGVIHGVEWSGRNPRRVDRRPGSFKVNVKTGRWADFATGDAGGDVISLVAYLADLSQREAAYRLSDMLGLSHVDG